MRGGSCNPHSHHQIRDEFQRTIRAAMSCWFYGLRQCTGHAICALTPIIPNPDSNLTFCFDKSAFDLLTEEERDWASRTLVHYASDPFRKHNHLQVTSDGCVNYAPHGSEPGSSSVCLSVSLSLSFRLFGISFSSSVCLSGCLPSFSVLPSYHLFILCVCLPVLLVLVPLVLVPLLLA